MDTETIRNLEVVRNLRTVRSMVRVVVAAASHCAYVCAVAVQQGDTKQSLFGVLNHTCTAGGTRLLRTSLLQPLSDGASISLRLATVDELLREQFTVFMDIRVALTGVIAGNEKAYFDITGGLADFLDLEHLAALQFVQHTVSTGLHSCEQVSNRCQCALGADYCLIQAISNVIYLKVH